NSGEFRYGSSRSHQTSRTAGSRSRQTSGGGGQAGTLASSATELVMKADDRYDGKDDYLKRLSVEYYRGQAYVHWSMTMADRQQGWLAPIFYYKFREILTHTMFRYGLCCPIYCCMPDHLHLLWIGILDGSDQRNAAKYFRKQLNPILEELGARFQRQPYDHVLREEDRERLAFDQ